MIMFFYCADMKNLLNRIFMPVLLICFIGLLQSCKSKELSAKDIEKIRLLTEKINTQEYTFEANNASPSGYQTIYLTSPYDLKVRKDSVIANLPYYGRAYVAPMNPTEGGFLFVSTNFDYKIKEKKDGWDISIQTKDINRNVRLYLYIGKSGYATLNVQDPNRQPISFSGRIEN